MAADFEFCRCLRSEVVEQYEENGHGEQVEEDDWQGQVVGFFELSPWRRLYVSIRRRSGSICRASPCSVSRSTVFRFHLVPDDGKENKRGHSCQK